MVSMGNRQEVLEGIRSGGRPVMSALKKLEIRGRMYFNGGFVRMEVSKASVRRPVLVATMRIQKEVMLGEGLATYDELTQWWRKYKSTINRDERLAHIVVALAWTPQKAN